MPGKKRPSLAAADGDGGAGQGHGAPRAGLAKFIQKVVGTLARQPAPRAGVLWRLFQPGLPGDSFHRVSDGGRAVARCGWEAASLPEKKCERVASPRAKRWVCIRAHC